MWLFLVSPPLQAAPFEPEDFFAPKLPRPETAASESIIIAPHREQQFELFREYGRQLGKSAWRQGMNRDETPPEPPPTFKEYGTFKNYTTRSANEATDSFLKGRYNRSRARLPENIEAWRRLPDIANPGTDLANWPNSAFTLPEGRAYLEMAPFGYYASSSNGPQQFDSEFLVRYGLTDNIELRLFGNGYTWTGGRYDSWNFAPLAFDTKIQCWTEKPDIFVPAMGIETYVQTEWLGSTPTNGGTQPAISFNFDQSLPWGIDFEYNLGAVRVRDNFGKNDWEFNFQWAFQRDFFNEDFALFIHGYINAATLPRGPSFKANLSATKTDETENVVGSGFVWTLNSRISVYGQTSFGTNAATPSLLSFAGFAAAF